MEKKTAVIDRIEQGIATVIFDDGSPMLNTRLAEDFHEGETVVIEADGTVRHAEKAEIPERKNKERLLNLFNKNKKD